MSNLQSARDSIWRVKLIALADTRVSICRDRMLVLYLPGPQPRLQGASCLQVLPIKPSRNLSWIPIIWNIYSIVHVHSIPRSPSLSGSALASYALLICIVLGSPSLSAQYSTDRFGDSCSLFRCMGWEVLYCTLTLTLRM